MADYAIHDTTLEAIADTIRKKDGTSALIDPADYSDRINLMGMLEEKTIVSSPIADFSDGADDVPTKSLVVTIPPTLSGVSAIECNKGGANFAELSNDDNPNKNAFTYTTLTPAKIEWEKTLSGGRFIVRFIVHIPKAGSYTFSEKNNTGGLYIYSDELWGNAVASNKATPYTYTFSTAGTYVIGIYNGGAIGTTGTLEEIACSYGSTAHAYEPYQTPTVYTASLGRTIYGGTADIVNGTGHSTRIKKTVRWGDLGNVTQLADVTRKEIVLSASEEAKYSMASASTDLLNDKNLPYDMTYSGNYEHIYIANSQRIWIYLPNDTDANTEISVSYTLADALQTDFTFDGQEIDTMLGYNAFWSDDGDTSVAYRSSGTIYNYPRGEEASF